MSKNKILIVDDEKPLRDMLAKWFAKVFDCQTAPDAAAALEIVRATPDLRLVLTDFKMPETSGLELARRVKAVNPRIAVIILTAHADVNLVIEAMRNGVDDFFQKPVTDLTVLEDRMTKALSRVALEQDAEDAPALPDADLDSFTGTAPAMQKVYRIIRKVAPTDATVLVTGPSGSGKELTARAIHNLSRRAQGPFVAVECSAIAPNLLESELFGSVKGAYTDARDRAGCFEAANGGTLFLDEIGEIDRDTQVKLLRVLESHTFQRVGESTDRHSDFRLVAATNRNLLKMMVDGEFREDLYYRLNVVDIHTPALKEHREDIPVLVGRFLKEFSAANGNRVKGIEPAALKALEAYDWPGNVRQLRNIVEKMVILAGGEKLTEADIPEEIAGAESKSEVEVEERNDQIHSPTPTTTTNFKLQTTLLADGERAQILAALERCHGNKSKAADLLGISRRTIYRKLKEWGID